MEKVEYIFHLTTRKTEEDLNVTGKTIPTLIRL